MQLSNSDKAQVLIQALPYIQKYNNKVVVIKYGGNAMTNQDITKTILQDITLLKYVGVNPVVVHGDVYKRQMIYSAVLLLRNGLQFAPPYPLAKRSIIIYNEGIN